MPAATRHFAPHLARFIPAVCFFLAACLMLALADAALAATSEACLRRCLTNCSAKDKAGGETCLRPCLKECPVHCGTVDTNCALDCLKREPVLIEMEAPAPSGDPWEATSKRSRVAELVGRCAEACVVKPDCQPVSHEPAPPRPPADLTPDPVAAPAAAPAPVRPRQEWKRFEPKSRSFSLAVPQGWTLQEQDDQAKGGAYELTLLGKGAALLDYAQISVRHVASPQRTVERFRHDLEHPAHAAPNAKPVVMTKTSLPGLPAGQPSELAVWCAESHGVRTLIGHDDSVPTLKRTLLLPQTSGYFVLALETPEATAEVNGQIFERLAQSFRPQLKARPRGPELSAAERAVWAGFFRSRGKIEQADQKDAGAGEAAGANPRPPARPDPNLGQPMQYLADTARTRLAHGHTLAAPALHKDALAELVQGCGGADTDKALQALAQAWDAVRGQQVLVADDILLPGPGEYGLDVQEEPVSARPGAAMPELMDGRAGQGRMSRPGGAAGFALRDGVVSLSRVAFSPEGDLALAYVAHGQTSPGTSHFVLLRRTQVGWALCGAAQHDMIIF